MEQRNIIRISRGNWVSVPKAWFEVHGIPEPTPGNPTKVIVLADDDIRIVNPKNIAKIYKAHSKIVRAPVEILGEKENEQTNKSNRAKT